MLSAQVFDQSLGGIDLAILLGCSVLSPHELRRQGQHLAKIWMHNSGLQDLMIVLYPTIRLASLQASLAVHTLAKEILRAVQGQQISLVEKLVALQLFAALKAAQILAKTRLKEAGPVVCPADPSCRGLSEGICLDAEARAQVVALDLILKASLKLQKRRIFGAGVGFHETQPAPLIGRTSVAFKLEVDGSGTKRASIVLLPRRV